MPRRSDPPSTETSRRPQRRRAVKPEERQVDAERSARALLDAALEEFAARGYAGARVRDIAQRAGVSKDLVSYHFGGKAGLYREVQQVWLDRERGFHDPEATLSELAVRYLHDALADPRAARLLAWRGLAADSEKPPDLTPDADELSGIIIRQDKGELAADLDPATLRLVLLGAITAPILMGDQARKLFGLDPASPEFQTRYAEGIRTLLAHLAPAADSCG
jgi:AcrR family transcriptional regulator